MRKFNLLAIALGVSIYLFGASTVSAETFTIMTEEYPPFNYTDSGKLTGVSTDIMMELTKRVGHHSEIKMLPWARAYGLIQKKDGQILFSMTRTEQREKLFKWVGPVAANNWVFFAKKGSGVSITSLEDAKKVGKIGTYKDDAAETFLKENGFTNIDSVIDDRQNVPKLIAGRTNLWIVGEMQGVYKAKQAGKADQLEKVYDVLKTELYIAFSKNTADEEIAKWQAALDGMEADGSCDAIKKNYM